MTRTTPDIAGLLGSRLCHDLISPLGAIANGVELLAMTGSGDSPEVQLIGDSVNNANAKIRFFRVAYGMASDQQLIGAPDIRAILQDTSAASRVQIDWRVEGELPRPQVKLAFLLIQCLETALIVGGRITVTARNDRWTLDAASDRVRAEPDLWDGLARLETSADIGPAQVQFLLAPLLIKELGRVISVERTETRIIISV